MSKPISETSKHRKLVQGYCVGAGIDVASAGDPIVPTAIQIEAVHPYCPFFDTKYPPQIRGDGTKLIWFSNNSMDYLYSAHLIEDFDVPDQIRILAEWGRVVKPGGHIVILAPERNRWHEALRKGQPPNNAHKHEPLIGEFTRIFQQFGNWVILEDRYCDGEDYSMFFVSRKR